MLLCSIRSVPVWIGSSRLHWTSTGTDPNGYTLESDPKLVRIQQVQCRRKAYLYPYWYGSVWIRSSVNGVLETASTVAQVSEYLHLPQWIQVCPAIPPSQTIEGILFSIRKSKYFLKNQGESGNLWVSCCFISELRLSQYSIAQPALW